MVRKKAAKKKVVRKATGGAVQKSSVNKAGNYTKPTMRKQLFNQIKAGGKAVSRASGLHVKRKCWPSSISRKVEATEINGTQEVPKILEVLDKTKVENKKR